MKLSSQSVTTGLTLGLTTLLIACGAEKTPHSTDANEANAAVSATAQTIQIAAKEGGGDPSMNPASSCYPKRKSREHAEG